jgi:hypothetical protein
MSSVPYQGKEELRQTLSVPASAFHVSGKVFFVKNDFFSVEENFFQLKRIFSVENQLFQLKLNFVSAKNEGFLLKSFAL